MYYNYIVIEGNIGAGKTTLSKKIADTFNAKLILEQFADNPFLPKFYENPDKYSFPLELSFLAERYQQLNDDLKKLDLFKDFTISDYYFMKSLIFSKQTLSADEYNLYQKIFNIIYKSLPKPDLYVYLHVSTENLMKNISKRGREYELNISEDYLKSIQNGYFDFFQKRPNYRFLIIDVNSLDFVNNEDDFQRITNLILNFEYPIGINRIILD